MSIIEESSLRSPIVAKIPRFNEPLRLAVLASGKGSNFEALVSATKNSILDATISLLIVNNPKSGAISKAKELNIPFICLNHKNFSSREHYDKELVNTLKPYKVEALVMAGWMRIATPTLMNEYPQRIINIHPSLLPSFKGIDAIEQALESGTKISGCTVHIVQAEVDSGPIIMQAAVPVFDWDTHQTLLKRIQLQEHKILPIGVAIAGAKWRESGIK